MTEFIEFDYPKFKRLKARVSEAERYAVESFIFEGREYLTDYARYVCQYLEPKFKIMGKKGV